VTGVKADRSRIDVCGKENLLARIEQCYLEPLLLIAQAVFAFVGEISLPANERGRQPCCLRAPCHDARRWHGDFRHLYIHCTATV
jgi:hypothetical protein